MYLLEEVKTIRKANFIKKRQKELLEGHIKTLKKIVEVAKINDITKISLSSKEGLLYRKKIKEFFGEKEYKEETQRRVKESRKGQNERRKAFKKTEKKFTRKAPPLELSQNAVAIRKKKIAEMGLEAYLEDKKKRDKERHRIYALKNKDKRKEYNKLNREKNLKDSRTRYSKNKEEILIKNKENFKKKLASLTEKERIELRKLNRKKDSEETANKKKKVIKEKKERNMKGLYFKEENREKRIKKNRKETKISAEESFLKQISYKKTEEVFSKVEFYFKDAFIIELKENKIFSLDETSCYGIYLKNDNIFDLLTLENNNYVLGIVGKNPNKESFFKRVLAKKISFRLWEDLENYIKAFQKGF